MEILPSRSLPPPTDIENDGKWHTLIIDVSTLIHFPASSDGSYTAQHLRLDVDGTGEWLEFAYLGYSDNLEDLKILTEALDAQ